MDTENKEVLPAIVPIEKTPAALKPEPVKLQVKKEEHRMTDKRKLALENARLARKKQKEDKEKELAFNQGVIARVSDDVKTLHSKLDDMISWRDEFHSKLASNSDMLKKHFDERIGSLTPVERMRSETGPVLRTERGFRALASSKVSF